MDGWKMIHFLLGILPIFRCENVMLVSGSVAPKKPDPSILICHLINHDPFKHFGADKINGCFWFP